MFKAERKTPSWNERLASSAISSEKRSGQALMMEGGIQSADEALAGEDVRTLRTLAALTGGMWENKGPKWYGSEKKGDLVWRRACLRWTI